MRNYSLSHLADAALLGQLRSLAARDRLTTADLLAHIAEVDGRRLYAPAGYPSMTAYCIQELRMSEDAAGKRIHAARTARMFPAIFEAVAEGLLHVSSVVMLAPRLTQENAGELLSAASGKTRSQIELLLAERFPLPDLPTVVLSPALPQGLLRAIPAADEHAPGRVPESVFVKPPNPPQRVAPRSEDRYGLQCMIAKHGHELMRYAQALLGPRVPASDLGRLVEMGFEALVEKLEKQKFGSGSGNTTIKSRNPRYVPLAVRRRVWLRDQGRCTFTSESGHRCEARSGLQYDHIIPFADGGQSTDDNMRLRCHAHNQYEAERRFGAGFMQHKRENARQARAERRAKATKSPEPRLSRAAEEVVPWLRGLGFKIAEASAAASLCEHMSSEPLEKRVRVALSYFHKGSGAGVHAVT